jgi:very-short-patch-repair endonuclease
MYFGATPDVFKKAHELRKMETETEKLLWSRLRNNQILGLHFRRQHPINRFIADFYCPRIRLVIEVDGSIHEIPENQEYDIGRSEILKDFGITIMRFTNELVIDDIEKVISEIVIKTKELLSLESKKPPRWGVGG